MPGKGNSRYGGQEHLVLKRTSQKVSVSQDQDMVGGGLRRWPEARAQGLKGLTEFGLYLSHGRHGSRGTPGSLKLSLAVDKE